MTPTDLLEQLKEFVLDNLGEMKMEIKQSPAKPPIFRSPEAFLMNLPDENAHRDKAPYVVLQLLNGNDSQSDGEDPQSTCNVRIVVCATSQNRSEGPLLVLNMLSRLRIALLEQRVIANRYSLRLPLEYIVYPDNPDPFYFGEMMTVWEMPTIERRVSYL